MQLGCIQLGGRVNSCHRNSKEESEHKCLLRRLVIGGMWPLTQVFFVHAQRGLLLYTPEISARKYLHQELQQGQ